MIHPTEDDLLAYVLETLPDRAEQARIDEHLQDCSDCRARLRQIRDDIDIIAGVRPRTINPHAPAVSVPTSRLTKIVRVAAIIVLSFAAGFATSRFWQREPAHVSPATTDWVTPASATDAAACDATAMNARAY